MTELVRCAACGGSIVYDVKAAGGACMFCGSVALSAVPTEEPLPVPHAAIPVSITDADADGQFRDWARSSWWYPKELRLLEIKVRAMLLPAWRFSSHLETHWAGLVSAATRSGKRPKAGLDEIDTSVMVPASGGLSQAELFGLQPYHESAATDWKPRQTTPWEPPQLTEHGARVRAHDLMAQWHAGRIKDERGLISCNVSPVIDDRDVRLLMLPIYIGAFRYREKPWRFVINAQTGEVVGDAPIDRLKVALVILGSIAAIGLIWALIAAFA
jgi:hypothetical protein